MQRKLSNGGDDIVEWDSYDDGDTICGEYDDFLILIKRLQSRKGWAYVVGTLEDAKLTGTVSELTEAKAIAPKVMTGSALLKQQESTFQRVA